MGPTAGLQPALLADISPLQQESSLCQKPQTCGRSFAFLTYMTWRVTQGNQRVCLTASNCTAGVNKGNPGGCSMDLIFKVYF